MKNILIKVAMLAVCFGLAGCGTTSVTDPTTGTVTTQPTIDPQLQAELQNIQQLAVQACGFLPTINTVAQVVTTFTGGGPIVGIAGQVASAICNAVTSHSAMRGGPRVPMVNGVPINGTFVDAARRRSILRRSTPMINGIPIEGSYVR